MKRRRQFCELWFRVRNGRWCDHYVGVFVPEGFSVGGYSTLTPWRIVDGARKYRWCTRCGRSEWA